MINHSLCIQTFYAKILPIILISRFHPASADELLKAFQVLDRENAGFLSKEFLSKIMMERGECFSQEELDEMMTAATDRDTGLIMYEFYINLIMVRKLTELIIGYTNTTKLRSCLLILGRLICSQFILPSENSEVSKIIFDIMNSNKI